MDVNVIAAPSESPAITPRGAPPPEVVNEPPPVQTAQQSVVEEIYRDAPNLSLMSEEFVQKTIDQINKSISFYNREMRISVHDETRILMIKVMDTDNERVIREIPPKKILDAFARTLQLAGILLDTRR